jgi:putative oxidoreductase
MAYQLDRSRRTLLGRLAALFAQIAVGWVFLSSGWGKLNNLPQVTENFVGWGTRNAQLRARFVSGVEFRGGRFLLVGLLSRISADALGISMQVGQARFEG